jgi:replicative DNA helicase
MSYNDLKDLSDEIERRIDINKVCVSYLNFRKGSGESNFYCGIPGHEDKQPSFIAKQGYQTYNCSSRCGTGNLYQLVEKVRGVTYPQAVLELANFAGIPESEIQLEDIMGKVEKSLKPLTKLHLEYLSNRGITAITAKKFNLSCYGEYIVFPQVLNRQIVSYKFMSVKDKTKKFFRGLNTTSKTYPNNDFSDVESVIFVAGEYDCMYLTQELEAYNLANKVETKFKVITGSTGEGSFPPDLVNQLIKYKDNIVNFRIFYDKDNAGKVGGYKLAESLNIIDKPIFLYYFPEDKKKGYDVSNFLEEKYSIDDLFNLNKEKYNSKMNERVTLDQFELERSVLNFLINNDEFIPDVVNTLRISDFKDYRFQTLYKNIQVIKNSYKYCDFDILKHKTEEISAKESIDEVIAARVLGSFEELKEIMEKIKLSSFITFGQRCAAALNALFTKNYTRKELQVQAAKIYESLITEAASDDKGKTMRQILMDYANSLNDKETLRYLSTPFEALNGVLQDGWRVSKLAIIGAYPSFGKTTLAIQFAEFVSMNKIPVAYYAKETDNEELAEQTLSRRTSLNNYHFRKRLFPHDFNTQEKIAQHTFETDDYFHFIKAYGMDSKEVINDIRVKVRRYGIKQAYIDLLQAFRMEKGYNSKREFIADFTADLVDLAEEENISIVLMSHLKTPESGMLVTKKPKLEDLAESSEVPRRGYTVIMIHAEDRNTSDIKLLIRKNRNGGADVEIDLKFERHLSRFVNSPELKKTV